MGALLIHPNNLQILIVYDNLRLINKVVSVLWIIWHHFRGIGEPTEF